VREDLRISWASTPQQRCWWANGGKILWDSRGNCKRNSMRGHRTLPSTVAASAPGRGDDCNPSVSSQQSILIPRNTSELQ
jgi:hypothetical protein